MNKINLAMASHDSGASGAAVVGLSGQVDVSEVYSPPRVVPLAEKCGLSPGFSLDLSILDPDDGKPWDFNSRAKRTKVMKIIKELEPQLLIGSPMCTAFSILQNINRERMGEAKWAKIMQYGKRHLQFACELYSMQVQAGRYFLHEHPESASSWKEKCIQRLWEREGVEKVTGHMCRWGMTSTDKLGEDLVKTPTAFMTN